MRSINVWAYHKEFGTLCRDARLDKNTGNHYPGGTSKGQAGWHVAIRFSNLNELAQKLSKGVPMPRSFCGNWFQDCENIQRGEIIRLAIMAHGDHGTVQVNGKKVKQALKVSNIEFYRKDLIKIGYYTRQMGSAILLMGCIAGNGEEGTKLLLALSRLWPGRTVVGFSTIGYRHPGEMKRTGEHCEHPGMRDTDSPDYIFANPKKYDRLWSNFERMPWANEKSKHAKIARNGCIVKYPEDESGHTCSSRSIGWGRVL